jgi:hypothetical protein
MARTKEQHTIARTCPGLRNDCMTQQELFAIVETVEHFHKYFYGQEFHLFTYHSIVTWLLSFKKIKIYINPIHTQLKIIKV